MTSQEIVRLMNRYIGGDGGYLGDFTYKSHAEFYPEYCGLDINPKEYPGTTRNRFEAILRQAAVEAQAKIIRGILAKYPPTLDNPLRTQDMHDELVRVAQRLEGMVGVMGCSPQITCEVVDRAIADAKMLIEQRDMVSAVDRVHTALHGYMQTVCDEESIAYVERTDIPELFALIREKHPAFVQDIPMGNEITKICRGMGKIVDALNHIRDQASMAHPNEELLKPAEALLAVNVAWTVLHYIDAKLAD